MSRVPEPRGALTACRASCRAPSSQNPSDLRLCAIFWRSKPLSAFVLFETPPKEILQLTLNKSTGESSALLLNCTSPHPVLGCPSGYPAPARPSHVILPARTLEIRPLQSGDIDMSVMQLASHGSL